MGEGRQTKGPVVEGPKKMERIPSMHDVLFQVARPTETVERAEFYDLSLSIEERGRQRLHLFLERHGWWDNENHRAIIDESLCSHSEAFRTFSEAVERYSRQRLMRAQCGFIHSFMWHPFTGAPTYYLQVGLDPETNGVSAPRHMNRELHSEPTDPAGCATEG